MRSSLMSVNDESKHTAKQTEMTSLNTKQRARDNDNISNNNNDDVQRAYRANNDSLTS